MPDDVGGRLNGKAIQRYADSVDDLGGRVDDADATHAELCPVVAGGLDLGVSQHGQQDVVDPVDLGVNQIDQQSPANKTRVQAHLTTVTK